MPTSKRGKAASGGRGRGAAGKGTRVRAGAAAPPPGVPGLIVRPVRLMVIYHKGTAPIA